MELFDKSVKFYYCYWIDNYNDRNKELWYFWEMFENICGCMLLK